MMKFPWKQEKDTFSVFTAMVAKRKNEWFIKKMNLINIYYHCKSELIKET